MICKNFYQIFLFLNIKDLKIEFSENELIEKIENIKQKNNLEFNTAELITNLYREVPLFVKEGGKYYWSHKSFQEYFISLKINEITEKEKFIERLMFSRNVKIYLNILEFLYDLGRKVFLRIFFKKVEIEKERIFTLSKDFDIEIKEKLFLYPKAYLYIIKKCMTEKECHLMFKYLVSKNQEFGEIDQEG